MHGSPAEARSAWPEAGGYSAHEASAEPVREPTEDTAHSARGQHIAWPSAELRSKRWISGRTAAGTPAPHDATEWTAGRISATAHATEYAGSDWAESGAATDAGIVDWILNGIVER